MRRKDFTTQVPVIVRVYLLKLRAVKQEGPEIEEAAGERKSEKKGVLETRSGGWAGMSYRCPLLPGLRVSWGPLELRRKEVGIQGVSELYPAHRGSFVFRRFIFAERTLGEVLREGLNRIFISFLSVSFNMLIHQNMGMEGSALFSG